MGTDNDDRTNWIGGHHRQMALGCASSRPDDSDMAGVPATSMNPGTGVTMPNTPIDSQTPGTNTTPADTMNAGSTGTMTGGSGNTGTPTDTGMNGTSPQPMMNDPMNNANPMNPMPAQPCPEGQERIEGVCQAVDSPMADESGLDLAGNYILQTNVTTIQSTPLGDQTSVTTLHGYLNITADGSGGMDIDRVRLRWRFEYGRWREYLHQSEPV